MRVIDYLYSKYSKKYIHTVFKIKNQYISTDNVF